MSKNNVGTEWSTGSIPKGPASPRLATDPASAHARHAPEELSPMDYAQGFGAIKRKAPGVDRTVALTITIAGEVTDE